MTLALPWAVLRAVLIGLAGAALAALAGLPAAPLIGSSVAVSVAAWLGLRLAIFGWLRNLGFLGIGLSLGSGVDSGLVSHLGDWSVSLGLLPLSLAVTLWAGAWLLQRVAGQDPVTAVLAASPGTMSYALAIAEERRADVPAVLVVQGMRLLLLAAVLPLLVQAFGAAPGLAVAPSPLSPVELAVLLVVGAAGGFGLARLGLPAAWLVGGFAVSGLAHGLGLAVGSLPGWAFFVAFALTGTVIGTRFSGLSPGMLSRNAWGTVLAVAVSAGVSCGFALLVASLTGLPFAQLWVAYAPGGVEAMAAIGLALGHDPAFIAAHHLSRIVILMVLVPLFVRRRAGN